MSQKQRLKTLPPGFCRQPAGLASGLRVCSQRAEQKQVVWKRPVLGQSRTGGPGTHCPMSPFGSGLVRHGTEKAVSIQDREAATMTSARDYCKPGHVTVAKQVRRHLGGELATFPWDPPGCRMVRTSSTVFYQEDNGGTDTHVPCHSCSLRGAASSVTSLVYFLSSPPVGFLLLCLPSLCASDQLITRSLTTQVALENLSQRLWSWTPY